MSDLIIDVGADISGADSQFGKLNSEITKLDGHMGKVSANGDKMAGSIDKNGKSAMGTAGNLGALTAGIGILGAGLFEAAKAAAEEEVGMARLQTVLKNSVKGYDEASAGVEDYVSSMTDLAFADDQIRDSLAFLVGQTGDLTEAQELQATAMDLARAKGISLEAATKAVGKVDQESIGILKKLGIQVTDNMTKEEALIAIREQTAGQAEAFAKGPAGQMEIAMNKMGDAVEDVGKIAMPILSLAIGVVQGAIDFLMPVVTGVFGFFKDNTPALIALGGVLTGILVPAFIAWATTMLTTTLPAILATMAPILAAAAPFIALGALVAGLWMAFDSNFLGIRDIVVGVWNTISGIFNSIVSFFTDLIPKVVAALVGVATAVWEWITATAGQMVTNVMALAIGFWTWITEIITWVGAKLAEIWTAIWGWISTTAVAIGTEVLKFATSFWIWITTIVGEIGGKIAEIAVAIWTWITGTAGEIGAHLLEWVTSFWTWITEVVGAIGGKLGEIASAIWGWITSTAKDIGSKIVEFAVNFWKWITEVTTNIASKIGEIASAIWTWITTTASDIGTKVLDFANKFWNWTTDVISNIGSKLGEIAQKVWDWVSQTAKDIYTKALEIGINLVKGMWDGFTGLVPAFMADAKTGIQMIIDAQNEQAGIKSPSTKTYETGKMLVQGLMDGFGSMMEAAINAIVAAMNALISAVKTTLGTSGGASSVFATIGQNAMAGLQKGIDDNGHLAVGAMKTQVGKLLPAARDNLGDFQSVGAKISAGVNAGINNTWGGVVDNIMSKARNLAAQARAALDIRSPSKVFEAIGEHMMEGWARGIERGAGKVTDALAGAVTGIMKDPTGGAAWGSAEGGAGASGGMVATSNQVIVMIDGVRVPARTTSGVLGERRRSRTRTAVAL